MSDPVWWKRGTVYQVYPRSFQDSDGDGVGDLAGIRQRLDHLQWLGVDAVWISPIYPSPMADFGYDVADYTGIHPMFGDLAAFDALVADVHRRGMHLILDFVPNHSSDEHPWFKESRSSRDNPKRDWYIWRDPAADGGPPTNWLSEFGGSAWTFDERTGQYYYHAFLDRQPDLNWRNPEVVAAMHDVLRFWMERGVDGFRVDVIWHMIKDDRFRDNPPNPGYQPGDAPNRAVIPRYTADRPEVHDVVEGLRAVIDEYPDRLIIGEIYLPVDRLVAYYGRDLKGVHLPFNFQLLQAEWHARPLAELIVEYERSLPEGGWPNWVLGNHDKPRIATRVGRAQARVAAMLLLTLRGTPTLYYGDEIGLCDVPIPPERVQDPFEKNVPGLGLGRDPQRTPMQWDDGPGAGFTTGEPWLPLTDDRARCNVACQRADPDSLLNLYRRLIALRRTEPVLNVGDTAMVEARGDILAYRRRHGDRHLLVALNLGAAAQRIDLPDGFRRGRVVLSTDRRREGAEEDGELHLDPGEGAIVEPA
ncbi:alpha-amylase family glycosyl hydrolase [Azospirillum sp. ST 5-10]|uniref:alpha-amylase family glycosyl hydrolase n=1 Tax=unclassified Azospirillum TaxID=2630922 RepID=UPI003F49C912